MSIRDLINKTHSSTKGVKIDNNETTKLEIFEKLFKLNYPSADVPKFNNSTTVLTSNNLKTTFRVALRHIYDYLSPVIPHLDERRQDLNFLDNKKNILVSNILKLKNENILNLIKTQFLSSEEQVKLNSVLSPAKNLSIL